MSGVRKFLRPEQGGRGLASADPQDVAERVADAWNGAIELVGRLDLDAPSRLPGWTARDVLVHLADWPEHPRFYRLLDDARHGRSPEIDDVHARNTLVVAAHQDADRDDITDALGRARDTALEFLGSADAEVVGREPAQSRVGLLPVTCVIAASAYELAVHALDLAPPGDVPVGLLDAGIGALVDTTGALAARSGVRVTFAVITPLGGWAAGTEQDDWTTIRLNAELSVRSLGWPTVRGDAAHILQASSGRGAALQLLITRRLRLHDVPGLMRLLPALESAPGLPGGVALRTWVRALGQTGGLTSRIGTTVSRE